MSILKQASTSRRHLMAGIAAGALLLGPVAPTAARTIDFDDATVPELEAAMAAGQLTSEKLVELCLARIQAYDAQGPKLHAIMQLNAKALEQAKALDAERKAGKVRSPIHGIPVVLKDNYDTADMPTTGGSLVLEGSIPSKDAFLVKKLRDAGAIILAKVNLSEFASGAPKSSLGGQSLNPHDLTRSPSGSSGGTGVSIAAGYAPLGMGTDTGGSIRGPSTANGVVGLKPTHGLLSRSGIIPLALTFDTGGPLTRNVADVAAMLTVMTGVDPADDATKKQTGKVEKDYTKFLNAGALKGARIGIARDFMGDDPDVDWVIEAAMDQMKKAGATVVDVRYPKWMLAARQDFYNAVRYPEFTAQIADYLKTTGPKYPKSLAEMIDRTNKLQSTRADGAGPNTVRWTLFKRELDSGSLQDYRYTSVRDHGLPMVRQIVEGVIATDKLDAIIYPTSSKKTAPLVAPAEAPGSGGGTNIANLTGFPDLIVPAGFTGENLPVGLSFLGPAFSEAKLISLGYSFEQATHARRRPVHTPALKDGKVTIPGAD
jgi:amidase